MMNKCPDCGARIKIGHGPYRYKESGLPDVVLFGLTGRHCDSFEHDEISIPRLEQLHEVLARLLANKRERLAPEEIRFLRKHLGWSGQDFAAHMGVTPETVSRWEQGAAAMGPQADRLLRLMAVTKAPIHDYSLGMLKSIAIDHPRSLKVKLRISPDGWRPQLAA